MSVMVLTLVIGVLNLCLGYVLAVRLGYGPPSLSDTWEVLVRASPTQPTGGYRPPSPARPHDGRVQEVAPISLEQMLNEPDEDAYDEPYDEPYDETYERGDGPVSEDLDPDDPENWELNERFIEVSVLKLNIAMMRSGLKATELDAALRAIQGRPDAETIQTCQAELLEDCETYLAEQEEAASQFRDRIGELGDLSALGDRIEMANLEQVARIETTIRNLRQMDLDSDLEAASLQLLKEIHGLRVARHKLRDDRERAFLVIARYENRLDQIEKQLLNDALTKLPNRIGLETALWQWWQEGRPQSRPMSAALFDLDSFGRVNERYGSLAGDRILQQLGRVVQRTVAEADLVGRFAGQRFLVVMVDVGPRAAVKKAEFIRQSIERITFLYGDEEIRVTAAGGLTEVAPDDTHETLFGRLEQALRQAKLAGPNRSFLHDGKEADLVESPNLGAEYVEIPI